MGAEYTSVLLLQKSLLVFKKTSLIWIKVQVQILHGLQSRVFFYFFFKVKVSLLKLLLKLF